MNKISRFFVNKSVIDYLVILVVLMTGMWQLFFCQAVMKWDMVDINLPWNYFISECINHGRLPLWNPYSGFGFPQYGDPGTWYPVNWIIGLFRQYDLYAIHFEYLLHLFLAATGMYKLGKFLGFSRQTRLIAAVTYMFSGFFIGNAQHIWWLINATWLPFAFLYFLRLHKNPGHTDALKLGLIFFLMLSGGYPGLFIPTGYLFLVTFVVLIIKDLKDRNYTGMQKFLLFLSIAVFIFVLAGLVVLISSFDFSAYINRGKTLPYDKGGVLFGAFSPRALLSILFSYPASINNLAYWGSDFSMVNTYFGFFSLLVLIFFLVSAKAPKQSIYFSAIAILFLMLAMPGVFPFRKWLYLYIPFMNMFRFASLFRLFTIFFLILAAGFSIEKLISGMNFGRKFMQYISLTGALLIVFLIVMYFNIDKWMFKALITDGFWYFDTIAGIGEKVFFQGVIFFGLVCILLLFLWRRKEWGGRILVLVIFAEMIISVQLNINATVVYPYSPEPIENQLKKLSAGFPVPSLNYTMKNTNDSTMGKNMWFLWHNLGELNKIPSGSSFSPYKLNTIQTAIKKNTLDAIIDHPLVFLAKSMTKSGWVDTSTILKTDPESIQITRFDPGNIEIITHTDTTLLLVLLQNYYPYWNSTIDDVKNEILLVNDSFMAVRLQKGDHHVKFEFRSSKIVFVFWISFLTWVLGLVMIIYVLVKNAEPGPKRHIRIILIILALFMFLVFFIINRQRYQSVKKVVPSLEDYASGLGTDSVNIVLNIDNPSEYSSALIHRAFLLRLQQRNDLSALQEYLMKTDSEYMLYAQVNTPFIPEEEWLINQYYPEKITRKEFGAGYYTLGRKGITEIEPVSYSSVNDFEAPVSGWSFNMADLDTMTRYSGKYSNRLDSVHIYSSTFIKESSEIPRLAGKHFRISLQAMTEPGADAFIVFDVTRKDKSIIWYATPLSDMMVADDHWSKVCMIKYLYEKLRDDDVLKIYVWNNSKGKVWIDNFRIEIVAN
jgi:hypothetical protein